MPTFFCPVYYEYPLIHLLTLGKRWKWTGGNYLVLAKNWICCTSLLSLGLPNHDWRDINDCDRTFVFQICEKLDRLLGSQFNSLRRRLQHSKCATTKHWGLKVYCRDYKLFSHNQVVWLAPTFWLNSLLHPLVEADFERLHYLHRSDLRRACNLWHSDDHLELQPTARKSSGRWTLLFLVPQHDHQLVSAGTGRVQHWQFCKQPSSPFMLHLFYLRDIHHADHDV